MARGSTTATLCEVNKVDQKRYVLILGASTHVSIPLWCAGGKEEVNYDWSVASREYLSGLSEPVAADSSTFKGDVHSSILSSLKYGKIR